MALFVMFFANYCIAMYLCYPRTAGRSQPFVPNFNSLTGSLIELFKLAFMGDPIRVFVDEINSEMGGLTSAQKLELLCFFFFYAIYCLVALVVLLNLLIAMLGFTFANVQ